MAADMGDGAAASGIGSGDPAAGAGESCAPASAGSPNDLWRRASRLMSGGCIALAISCASARSDSGTVSLRSAWAAMAALIPRGLGWGAKTPLNLDWGSIGNATLTRGAGGDATGAAKIRMTHLSDDEAALSRIKTAANALATEAPRL